MNQAEPLSATMAPYVLRASATALAGGPIFEVSTELLSRSRNPMGGNDMSAAAPAWCQAGQR